MNISLLAGETQHNKYLFIAALYWLLTCEEIVGNIIIVILFGHSCNILAGGLIAFAFTSIIWVAAVGTNGNSMWIVHAVWTRDISKFDTKKGSVLIAIMGWLYKYAVLLGWYTPNIIHNCHWSVLSLYAGIQWTYSILVAVIGIIYVMWPRLRGRI